MLTYFSVIMFLLFGHMIGWTTTAMERLLRGDSMVSHGMTASGEGFAFCKRSAPDYVRQAGKLFDMSPLAITNSVLTRLVMSLRLADSHQVGMVRLLMSSWSPPIFFFCFFPFNPPELGDGRQELRRHQQAPLYPTEHPSSPIFKAYPMHRTCFHLRNL